jgi:hypothetical protein
LPTSKDTPRTRLRRPAGVLKRPAYSRFVRRGCPDRASRERRRGDKPGMTSLAQRAEVRRVQRETGRIYSICYSYHFATRCTVEAGELVAAGAIGCVIDHEVPAMPHRGDAQRSALARDGGGLLAATATGRHKEGQCRSLVKTSLPPPHELWELLNSVKRDRCGGG